MGSCTSVLLCIELVTLTPHFTALGISLFIGEEMD